MENSTNTIYKIRGWVCNWRFDGGRSLIEQALYSIVFGSSGSPDDGAIRASGISSLKSILLLPYFIGFMAGIASYTALWRYLYGS